MPWRGPIAKGELDFRDRGADKLDGGGGALHRRHLSDQRNLIQRIEHQLAPARARPFGHNQPVARQLAVPLTAEMACRILGGRLFDQR